MSFPIQCRNLTKKFRRFTALDGLDLDVPEGSVYALVGTNGAGKTTAITTMMNIQRADSGSATIVGTDSQKLGPHEFARIGYVSEDQKLPGWMTVPYLMNYLKLFYPTWDDRAAAELLRQFNLPLDRKLKNLSRGTKMKVALASSLAYHPEILILDEPFSGLDALVRDELVSGLLERIEGTTILISSHDLAEIESFSSHVGYLENGRLRFSEEMTTLADRFREIEVTLEGGVQLPNLWPGEWMPPETSPAVIRFVDTGFSIEGGLARVRHAFPAASNIAVRPMPLREIFVALARAGREAA